MSGQKLIFLLGYMGTGKSTTGRRLANRLGWRFVDLDARISQFTGQSIAETFSDHGERVFRRIERMQMDAIFQEDGLVVALGGGTPCFYDNMDRLLQNGTCIYLRATPAFIASRLWQGDRNSRPLISGVGSKEELQRLVELQLSHREEDYLRSQVTVDLPCKLEEVLEVLGQMR